MGLRSVGKIRHTTVVTLRDPATNKPLAGIDDQPMTVTLHGPYSARYKKVLREQQQTRVATAQEHGGAITISPEEMEAYTIELLVQCIEGWTVTLEGDEIAPVDPDGIRAVLDEFPWVADQLNAALGNTGNFLDRPVSH